jgi:hypothetical protein
MQNLWGAGAARLGAALCATGLLLGAGATRAATYSFDITGAITSQLSAGTDANIAVGDIVHVMAQVDASRVVTWGATGKQVAFLDRHSPAGTIFDVTLNSLSWRSNADIYDGLEMFQRNVIYHHPNGPPTGSVENFGAPAIVFEGDQVVGLIGYLSASGSSAAPVLRMGTNRINGFENYSYDAAGGLTYTSNLSDFATSLDFRIEAPEGLYGNFYQTPGFTGVWSGSVTAPAAVPEPESWATLLAGFFLAGWALRFSVAGHRRQAAPQSRGGRRTARPSAR